MNTKQLIALALLGGALPSIGAAGTGSSLRIMTYNTAFMILDFGFPIGEIETNGGEFGGMNYADRAQAISNAVLAGDNDVVAFNEVFSSTGKDVLVQNLKAKYPYYIRQIKGDAPNPWAELAGDVLQFVPEGLKPATNDSGLMIFSKFPFVPFSASASPMQVGVTTIDGMNGASSWGTSPYEVSAFTYIANTHDDGLASKAVAMVRVKKPDDGQISNIAFTHMQADKASPDSEGIAVRNIQFDNIRKLITKSLTTAERKTQAVYLIGDANVVGSNKKYAGPSEWQSTFQDPGSVAGGFFSCGNGACDADLRFMTDSWGFETSVEDAGVSNNVDGARLDYVLHNKPTILDTSTKPASRANLCMQYIAIAPEATIATPGGSQQLSDHLPVRADFNKRAPYCSADDSSASYGPRLVKFAAAQDLSFAGKITYPGSMQWYRIDKPGSYSIKLGGTNLSHVAYEVYAGRDLSNPLPPFYNEVNGRYGPKFVMPAPPYYVRVFAKDAVTGKPDRQWKGNYSLSMHEYRGTSALDAIGLAGGITTDYVWPGPNTLEYPTVWFEFHTNQTSSGQFPDVDFYHEVPVGQDLSLYGLTLNKEVIVNGQKTYPQIPFAGVTNTTMSNPPHNPVTDYAADNSQLPGNGGNPKKYYLKLSRDQFLLKNVPMTTRLTFGTTLTYIKPIALLSRDMKDDWPDRDNIELQFAYDGAWQQSSCSGADCLGPTPYGTDEPHALDGFKPFQKTFADNVVFNLWSEGYYFEDIAPPPWYSEIVGTSALGHFEGQCNPCETAMWRDHGNVDDADFWYEMTFNKSHDPSPY